MEISNEHLKGLNAEDLARLDEIVAQFEKAWHEGQSPAIEAFLAPAEEPARRALLIELIQIDLEYRWKAGQAVSAESYLQRYPELAADERFAASLAANASRLRENMPLSGGNDETRQIVPLASNATPPPPDLLAPQSDSPLPGDDAGATRPHDSDEAARMEWSAERPSRLGKFELLEMVGQGSFGMVFRAQDTELGRIVAIKTPRTTRFASKEHEDRFIREAQNVARLHHPGIVAVHEVGRAAAFLYIVSEFVDGKTLSDVMKEHAFDVREAAQLVAEIADALEHAHQQGIIHRDLKPSNIMLEGTPAESSSGSSSRQSASALGSWRSTSSDSTAQSSSGFRPRLMDFGLARRVDAEISATMEGDILGTPAYMSPEQARGEAYRVDGRSDLYSLGVVLYQLLTGELPFRGTVRMLLHQVLYDEPPRPRRLNDRIPRDLETIALKCLAKDPARRYSTAAELAAELRRFLSGIPILARPVGPAERVWRWCRRNPLVATLSLLAAAGVLFGLVATSVGYVRTSRALEQVTAAQKDSEASFEEARQAVDDLFTRVSEDALLNQPGMQPLRRDLLLRARDYYERFLARRGRGSVPESEVALTHFRVGLICEEIESPAKGLSAYDRAYRIQKQLLAAKPEAAQVLEGLGATLNAIGRCRVKQRLLDEGVSAYEEAIAVRDQLVHLMPRDVEAKRRLANVYMNMGLARRTLNPAESRRNMEQAQALRRQLLRAVPGDLKARRDFGMGAFNLAALARDNGAVVEADRLIQEAIDCFRDLVEADPSDLQNRYQLAVCHRVLADSLSQRGAREESLAPYGQAREVMEILARQNTSVVEYHVALAEIGINMGQTLQRLNRADAALELFLRAEAELAPLVTENARILDITELPRAQQNYLAVLKLVAENFAKLGRLEESLTTLESLQDHLVRLQRQFPKISEVSRLAQVRAAITHLRDRQPAHPKP